MYINDIKSDIMHSNHPKPSNFENCWFRYIIWAPGLRNHHRWPKNGSLNRDLLKTLKFLKLLISLYNLDSQPQTSPYIAQKWITQSRFAQFFNVLFVSKRSDNKKSVIPFPPDMPPSPWQIGLKDKSVMHSDLEIVVA